MKTQVVILIYILNVYSKSNMVALVLEPSQPANQPSNHVNQQTTATTYSNRIQLRTIPSFHHNSNKEPLVFHQKSQWVRETLSFLGIRMNVADECLEIHIWFIQRDYRTKVIHSRRYSRIRCQQEGYSCASMKVAEVSGFGYLLAEL